MNQYVTGAVIKELREKKQLTQAELAEKLNYSDKAVSKWERGMAMPDSSIMLELCSVLGISVNDLLCGEVVQMDNYNEKLEKQLLEMVKQKEQSDKHLLAVEVVIGILSLVILFVPIIFAAYLPLSAAHKLALTFSGFIPALVGFFFALRIEQVAGYYECKNCSHKYVPDFRSTAGAMHMGRTRYMKCPSCGKRTWQKKVIKKYKKTFAIYENLW